MLQIQAGIGNEYINNFIVKPSALFKITPKDPLSSKFEVKSIEVNRWNSFGPSIIRMEYRELWCNNKNSDRRTRY